MILDILRQMDLNITDYKRQLCITINSFESRLNIELQRFLWLDLTCRRHQKKRLENRRKKLLFFNYFKGLTFNLPSPAPFLSPHT